MTNVAIIGSGYVGTVVAAAFAHFGNDVRAVEVDPAKLELLRAGHAPFFEAGLDDLLAETTTSGTLRFTASLAEALHDADIAFLCLGTPEGARGRPDLSAIQHVGEEIGAIASRDLIIVTKSTVPVGSNNQVRSIVEQKIAERGAGPLAIRTVANPEFLRAGTALNDFLHPDRIVLGSDDHDALARVRDLYRPIIEDAETPTIVLETDLVTAETIKYAANSFLAMKVSFINEIAQICDRVGADVTEVAYALGLDARISPRFLNAGLGWGGSCFGKDLAALTTTAYDHGFEPSLLNAIRIVNDRQRGEVRRRLQDKLGSLRGRRVALLGLAFKPGTDDTRDAPAIDIATQLHELGALVSAHDPLVHVLPELDFVRIADDPYAAATGADAVVLTTEWPEFVDLDFERLAEAMSGRILIDGRNALDREKVRLAGLAYEGIGRAGSFG